LPKDATKNLAKNVFRAVHPAAENVDVARMMGRWFQVGIFIVNRKFKNY